MKIEIIDLKTFKIISENDAERIIINNWIGGIFKYKEGLSTNKTSENIYEFYPHKK